MSTDLTIYIHTLGRWNDQSTLIYLKSAGVFPVLVVEPHEEQSYRMIYKSDRVLCLPEKGRGLSHTRQWLLENCPTQYMVLCDDDLRFSRKQTDDRTKLREPKPEDMAALIRMVKSKLTMFAHVGISARGGNNLKTSKSETNERMMRFLAYDRNRVPPDCRFDRVPCKQDFDMTLQLLRKGLPNCVIYEFAQDQVKQSNAPGGCANYRTEDMVEEAARELQRLHPKFVKLVEKTNNNWKGFEKESRLEVKIAWKQAAAAGSREGIMV